MAALHLGRDAMSAPWRCRVCTTTNEPDASACVVCHESKATSPTGPSDGGARVPVANLTPSRTPTVHVPGAGGSQRGSEAALGSAPSTPPETRSTVALVALIVVMAIGLVAIGALLLTQGDERAETATPDATESSTEESASSASDTAGTVPETTAVPATSAPAPDPEPQPVDLGTTSIVTRASSVLPPVARLGLTYGPENLLDGNLDTAWSQAGSDGGIAPVGSWVAFDLPQTTDVMRVSVINGYVKSDETYAENARVRDITISDGSGRSIRTTLDDVRTSQAITVDFPSATTITITVESVYPGSEHLDVALTEVRLAGLATG